ncbi:MAG: cytochrome c [Methylocystis sp.]
MILPLRLALFSVPFVMTPLADAGAVEKSTLQDIVLQCETCHGLEGKSEDKGIPNIAALNERYIVQQLRNFRSGKRPHGEMRDMGGLLTDEEMRAVAQHFSKLPR